MIAVQVPANGSVRLVQVAPSGDVAQSPDEEIAQNNVPFQATSTHVDEAGSVRAVQLIPSVDVAAFVPPPTAQNRLPPQHKPDQDVAAGNVPAVQETPFIETADTDDDAVDETVQKIEPFHFTLLKAVLV